MNAGDRYLDINIKWFMYRMQRLKVLTAASLRLKTLNDKSLIKRLIKTYCIEVFISMFNLNSNKTK